MRLKAILFLIILVCFVSCTERPRDNIFDPEGGTVKTEVELRALAGENFVELSWSVQSPAEFVNIEIYRKSPGQSEYILIDTVPAEIDRYIDTVQEVDQSYSYYIVLLGEDSPTDPSETVEAIPGPGDIWLVDRGFGEVLHLTYDLRHTRIIRIGNFFPENLAIAEPEPTALLTYPLYGYFELFDPTDPYRFIYESSQPESPFDALYDPVYKTFWITDSSGSIYRLNTESSNLSRIAGNLGRPTSLGISGGGQVYVLDEMNSQVVEFSRLGDLVGTVNPQNISLFNPVSLEIDKRNNMVYIVDRLAENDVLYAYSKVSNSVRELAEYSRIQAIAADERGETIWIAARIDLNFKIMQLSPGGIRLNMLEEYEFPVHLAVNPYNGNLIIIDGENVVHVRSDGTVIGSYSKAGQPYKVLIE